MASALKYWREAATLIIAARTRAPITSYLGNKKLSFDYQILVLQRNAKAGFFPSAQVFPGGGTDRADFSPEWLDVFKKYGNVHSIADFGRMVNIKGPRPPMVLRDHQSPLPVDVAYRISAIRETFEECGILLLREKTSEVRDSRGGGVTLGGYLTLSDSERNHWRKMVYKDPGQFLTLCHELRCYPDIWSLAEWSDWLTPSNNTKRRYDTMFYIACLDSMPDAFEDNSEIVQSKWETPLQSLQMFVNGETYLPPPQLYEFRRLLRFESFNRLSEFCSKRAFEGIIRFLPVRCDIEDAVLSILPGDDDYPDVPVEETGKEHLLERREITSAESYRPGLITNRMLFRSVKDCEVVHSSQPACGHVIPVTDRIPVTKGTAKL